MSINWGYFLFLSALVFLKDDQIIVWRPILQKLLRIIPKRLHSITLLLLCLIIQDKTWNYRDLYLTPQTWNYQTWNEFNWKATSNKRLTISKQQVKKFQTDISSGWFTLAFQPTVGSDMIMMIIAFPDSNNETRPCDCGLNALHIDLLKSSNRYKQYQIVM